jgi:prepilin-type N-terminal cleavage/methylation domain-containing protein
MRNFFNKKIGFSRKNIISSGFTLVELLVTITIFTITTGIIMFSQGKFDNSVLLSNLAYDIAITIRQAQTYGVNVKEFGSGTGKFVGYGVYFDLTDQGSNKQFDLFADTMGYTNGVPGDYKFNGDFSCPANDPECVNKYVIKRGNFIYSVCAGADETSCDATASTISRLVIDYKRPVPDAKIFTEADDGSLSPYDYAKIVVSSPDGSSKRSIVVTSTGQIYVK